MTIKHIGTLTVMVHSFRHHLIDSSCVRPTDFCTFFISFYQSVTMSVKMHLVTILWLSVNMFIVLPPISVQG